MSNFRSGKLANKKDLIDIQIVSKNYFESKPNFNVDSQKVIFGTSGHRGSSLFCTFNEIHIKSIVKAIVDFRKKNKITGPCFIGKDTHFLSELAFYTVIEVLTANRVNCIIDHKQSFTPTPVISREIIKYNKNKSSNFADGIILTPSHNPPQDGGIKYNGINGEPADFLSTNFIQAQANFYLNENTEKIKQLSYKKALKSEYVSYYDFETNYINDLDLVLNFDVIKSSTLKLGVDPLGGAGIYYWKKIAEKYKINLKVVNNVVDPTFSFMHLDHDEVVRMDCSSAHAMAGLINIKDKFDLSFASDPDHDRHGIVSHLGLMPSNDYLATSIFYLFNSRPMWNQKLSFAKTVVTSHILNKISVNQNHEYLDYPVGFKWFSDGLINQKVGFACEESAGATFLAKDGTTWTTDKDGIIMCLLAAEMTAKMNKIPQVIYNEIEDKFGKHFYSRIQAPLSFNNKSKLSKLDSNNLKIDYLAGDKVKNIITHAPANSEPIGGIKIETDNGWFAARPSGTEDAYKIYAESFKNEQHLAEIEDAAKNLVDEILI